MYNQNQRQDLFFDEKGQAVTEMLIGLTLLVPLLLAIGVIAQYLDIQFKTHEAARYAAWERTVWAENKAVTEKAGNIVKPGDELHREIDKLFFQSPRAAIHQKSGSPNDDNQGNLLWRDQTGEALIQRIAGSNEPPVQWYRETTGNTPATNAMDLMKSYEVGDFSVGLNAIRRKNFSQISIERPLTEISFLEFGRMIRNKSGGSNAEDSNLSKPSIRSKSAILSQTWMATDEETMADTIDNMVLDGHFLNLVGETIGYAIYQIVRLIPIDNFPFKDIEPAFANKTRLIPEDQSLILPNYAIKGRTEPLKTITIDVGEILQWQ